MSLLADIEAARKRPGGVCSVPLVIADLSPEDGAELEEALASRVESSAIVRALDARGIRLSASTIQRHRRRDCACP